MPLLIMGWGKRNWMLKGIINAFTIQPLEANSQEWGRYESQFGG